MPFLKEITTGTPCSSIFPEYRTAFPKLKPIYPIPFHFTSAFPKIQIFHIFSFPWQQIVYCRLCSFIAPSMQCNLGNRIQTRSLLSDQKLKKNRDYCSEPSRQGQPSLLATTIHVLKLHSKFGTVAASKE